MALLLSFVAAVFSMWVRAPAGVAPPLGAAAQVAGAVHRAGTPRHVEAARGLLAAMTPEKMEYRHRPSVVVFEVGREECRTDCSGFITAVLRHSYGLSDEDVRRWLKSKRPVARTYARATREGQGFSRVEKVEEWRAGDVLAVEYPREAEDTGHTMIVDARPLRRDATAPLLDGTVQYEVTVIDVTGSPHSRDTRRVGGMTHAGLGKGVIRVYADAEGRAAGYTWGLGARSELRRQGEREMVAGRWVGMRGQGNGARSR
ncbi:MAG TPA: hypothetical protein VD997_06565 [Phycisphaerales bacterium]|nr:hypothetical protein [Phycisphaerales bacterium]